jgi:hypothetical protein
MGLYSYVPREWNGLCLVADARLKSDQDQELHEGGKRVYDLWGFGRAACGPEWQRTMRVCLYDYGEDTAALNNAHQIALGQVQDSKKMTKRKTFVAEQRKAKRAELIEFLEYYKPRCVVVLQTPSIQVEENLLSVHGTMCWDALSPPDSLLAMQGTCWDSHAHNFGPIVPLLNPMSFEYAWGWPIRRWLLMAIKIAGGQMRPLTCSHKFFASRAHAKCTSNITEALVSLLHKARTGAAPIAIDIESYSPQNLITAVGVSDGITAISMPWEQFQPYGKEDIEPGLADSDLGALIKQVLATDTAKIFHNRAYDIPFLAAKGVPVNGECHDSMGMHREVYRQFRHGLQMACAIEFCVRPWKSEWNPKVKGLTKSNPDYWICDPMKLREYNCDDAFNTWHLGKALAPKIGLRL